MYLPGSQMDNTLMMPILQVKRAFECYQTGTFVKMSFTEKNTETDVNEWLDTAIKRLKPNHFQELLAASFAHVDTSESPAQTVSAETSTPSAALDCYDRSSPIPENE
jgi:hypothetical protein